MCVSVIRSVERLCYKRNLSGSKTANIIKTKIKTQQNIHKIYIKDNFGVFVFVLQCQPARMQCVLCKSATRT